MPSQKSQLQKHIFHTRDRLENRKRRKLAICRVLAPERVTRIMSAGLLLEVDRVRSWSCTTSSLSVNKRERVSGQRHIVSLTASPLRREVPDERQRLLVVTVRS